MPLKKRDTIDIEEKEGKQMTIKLIIVALETIMTVFNFFSKRAEKKKDLNKDVETLLKEKEALKEKYQVLKAEIISKSGKPKNGSK